MPSYVNIGAYVDEGTWWTRGRPSARARRSARTSTCRRVGIGGVLEPLQANPTIIEDGCFIGARSEVVEGVIVEAHSVLAMGVFISQSTKIYDRATGEILCGRVPSGSVVVPGSLPSSDGKCSSHARSSSSVWTRRLAKTSINELRAVTSRPTPAAREELIARPLDHPADEGCLSLVASRLSAAGFACERIDRGPVGNLWARHGSSSPVVCLAGHVDVVPPGP